MILVLVGQAPQPGRNLELGNNAPFADYVATELLPHVRSKWRATSEPRQAALCGSSAGGLGSAYIAYRHPEVFGNVLSQSGAFWPGKERNDPAHEWVIHQYESSPKLPILFVLQPGVLEIVNTPLNCPPILSSNRHLRDVLQAKGYEVYYSETAGGHEPLNWRGGFAEGPLAVSAYKKLADALRLLEGAAPEEYSMRGDREGNSQVHVRIGGATGEACSASKPRAITWAIARAVGIEVAP